MMKCVNTMLNDPQRAKYDEMYMNVAKAVREQSSSLKRKVGAVVVVDSGALFCGFNGTPPGYPNVCEKTVDGELKALPTVIHAERNALDKLHRQGITPVGSTMYTTTAPCLSCALSIAAVGVSRVVYLDPYKNNSGLNHLTHQKIKVEKFICKQ